ncbi:hypothetical protein GCM10010230_08950 [Streptomyces narbonensis]|nr:hypothetical protein GCM10010230_08950 [Streptomyces narbonensis]
MILNTIPEAVIPQPVSREKFGAEVTRRPGMLVSTSKYGWPRPGLDEVVQLSHLLVERHRRLDQRTDRLWVNFSRRLAFSNLCKVAQSSWRLEFGQQRELAADGEVEGPPAAAKSAGRPTLPDMLPSNSYALSTTGKTEKRTERRISVEIGGI